MNKKRIIITGGGTLGHIMPIIPVVMKIYNDYDLFYIGTKKGNEKEYIDKNGIMKYFKKIYYLDMVGIDRKNVFKNINVIIKYIKIKKQIKKIFNNINPNLVVGMGGYISGVVIKQATNNKIKTIIHEQNSIMGLSNKLVYKKVNKVLLTNDIENLKINNKYVIGNPRLNYVREKYKTNDKNYILIFGGSLGSDFINDLIIKNIEYFKINDYLIYLVVGKKYYNNNSTFINEINHKYKHIKIYSFLDNILDIMKDASLIIARSGASTISEILGLQKPSILIPSPNVTNNHQYFNALELYNKGCCELINENELTKEKLYEKIIQIITNFQYKGKMITNINKYYNINPLDEFINVIKEEI